MHKITSFIQLCDLMIVLQYFDAPNTISGVCIQDDQI